MIKTIIFDLGNVIVPLDFPAGYRAISDVCGIAPAELPARIGETGLVPKLESGQIEPRDFIRQLCAALGLNVSEPEFRRLWSSIFPPHTLIPDNFVAALKRKHRLLLLSNTNAIHFEMIWENYPLLRHMDDLILSHQVGAMKPSEKIYQTALDRAGCEPGECFFTDDIPAYVEGARRHGIDAVQFTGFESLARELEARGVRW